MEIRRANRAAARRRVTCLFIRYILMGFVNSTDISSDYKTAPLSRYSETWGRSGNVMSTTNFNLAYQWAKEDPESSCLQLRPPTGD